MPFVLDFLSSSKSKLIMSDLIHIVRLHWTSRMCSSTTEEDQRYGLSHGQAARDCKNDAIRRIKLHLNSGVSVQSSQRMGLGVTMNPPATSRSIKVHLKSQFKPEACGSETHPKNVGNHLLIAGAEQLYKTWVPVGSVEGSRPHSYT
jgi:hypothetical protein